MVPDVSVIMPCFNHGRFIEDSMNSILQQTHANLELIVADDCSSDDSWEVAQSIAAKDDRVIVLKHPANQGASRSRNSAIGRAKGQFIGFCDADDVWESGKLEFQLSQLTQHPDRDVAYCDSTIIDEQGAPTGERFSQLYPPPPVESGDLFAELLLRNFINMQSVLVRRQCIERVGLFDEGVKWVEDWWYWIQMAREHRFIYSTRPLARYRVHRNSTNKVRARGYCVNRFKVYRKILNQYPDLSGAAKGRILYEMGVELGQLKKAKMAGSVLALAMQQTLRSVRTYPTAFKAACRWMMSQRAAA